MERRLLSKLSDVRRENVRRNGERLLSKPTMSDGRAPDCSLSSAKPDERAPTKRKRALGDVRWNKGSSLSSATSDGRLPTKHGRAPDGPRERGSSLSSAMSDGRAPAEPGGRDWLSDVRWKSASQTGRSEAALQAQRRPMKERRQTRLERPPLQA